MTGREDSLSPLAANQQEASNLWPSYSAVTVPRDPSPLTSTTLTPLDNPHYSNNNNHNNNNNNTQSHRNPSNTNPLPSDIQEDGKEQQQQQQEEEEEEEEQQENQKEQDNQEEEEEEEQQNQLNQEWRNAFNDPYKSKADLKPYLEQLASKNQHFRQEVHGLKQKLRTSNSTHRGSIVALHNKMFKKLLDAEEEHDNSIEEGVKKINELERKIEAYETAERNQDINECIKEFISKQKEYAEQIEQLTRQNKELESQLSVERKKTEEISTLERSKSVGTLHNRMFKKFIEAEESSEEKIKNLKARVEQLERELRIARDIPEEKDGRRKSLSLSANPITNSNSDNYMHQIKELKQLVKYLELENATLKQNVSTLSIGNGDPSDLQIQAREWKTKYHSANREANRLREELKETKQGTLQDQIEHYKQMYEQEKKKLHELQEQMGRWINSGNDDTIRMKQEIAELEKKVFNAHNKAEGAEKHRRESIHYLSNQMMTSLVDAEDIHKKELNEQKAIINRLEEEKKTLNLQLHAEERKRKHSNAEVSATMFNKMLLLEQEKEAEKKYYEARIKELEEQLQETASREPRRASEVHSSMFKTLLEAEADYNSSKAEWDQKENEYKNQLSTLQEELNKMKQKADHTDRQRRESITRLQDDMWKHLVEADEENRKERKKLLVDLKNFKDEVATLRKRVIYLENSKLAMIDECNRQMNILRAGVRVMNKQ